MRFAPEPVKLQFDHVGRFPERRNPAAFYPGSAITPSRPAATDRNASQPSSHGKTRKYRYIRANCAVSKDRNCAVP
jgi:hypothetical protein